jgi:hypothetical protein
LDLDHLERGARLTLLESACLSLSLETERDLRRRIFGETDLDRRRLLGLGDGDLVLERRRFLGLGDLVRERLRRKGDFDLEGLFLDLYPRGGEIDLERERLLERPLAGDLDLDRFL